MNFDDGHDGDIGGNIRAAQKRTAARRAHWRGGADKCLWCTFRPTQDIVHYNGIDFVI